MAELLAWIFMAAIAVLAVVLGLALLGLSIWIAIVVLGVLLYFASIPVMVIIWILGALGLLSAATVEALREAISGIWKKTSRLFKRKRPQAPEEQPNTRVAG